MRPFACIPAGLLLAGLVLLSTAASATQNYEVTVTNLSDGETVWNDARQLALTLDLRPPLAAARGHRIEVYVDGSRRAADVASNRVVIDDVDRGTHHVQARVVDRGGRTLGESATLTIHHKQHSVILPN